MKVITKYISKQILSVFFLCSSIFVLLYLVIDFVQRIDNFARADVPLPLILLYFLYKIPTMAMEVIPAATMISIVVVICQMKKNKEIMAMKACGLNLHKVFLPVITISIIIYTFSLFFSEMVVPYTSTRSNEIKESGGKKKSQASFQEWYKSKNNIYWIRHFDIETKTISDPVFYFFDDQFKLLKKISGKSCKWLGGEWELEDAEILTLEKDSFYHTEKQQHYALEIPETPDTFISKMRKPADMSYGELRKHSLKLKAQGYDNTSDRVNLYMKLSYPFMSVVFALIAIPLGLWEKINGIPLSVTFGMLTMFLLFVVMGAAKALGLAGTLPPLLSAWTANVLFSFTGIYFLMNIKK